MLAFAFRLPQTVKPSMFIGLACLPQRYQPLPKEHECTIIGWGKRRSADQNGTNLLHEAEVSVVHMICVYIGPALIK